MSDGLNKAEKLAVARKKLKEFQIQQKNKENIDNVVAIFPEESKLCEQFSQNNPIILSQEKECYNIHSEDETKRDFLTVNSNEERWSDISNYFSNVNNNIFSDIVKKPDFPQNQLETSVKENCSTNSNVLPKLSLTESKKLEKEDISADIQNLKHALSLAEIKIKMQAEALDIVTAEREEVQLKLISSEHELNVSKENILLLKKQLEVNVKHEEELKVNLTELKQMQQESSVKILTLEQTINDLKEKNDELCYNLEMQLKKNNSLAKQLEETLSSRDMLTLKFQQLGIEIGDDPKSCNSEREESNSLMQKYREMEEQLKTLVFEREHTEGEYRHYIDNLKEELRHIRSELQMLERENQILTNKVSCQTEHINGLEKQLQKERIDENDKHIADLKNSIQILKEEIELQKEQNESLLLQLSDYNHWKEEAYKLQRDLETLKIEITKSNELQMAVESNKVAASQAISQNNKLKKELEKLNEIINLLNSDKKTLSQMLDLERIQNTKLADSSQMETLNLIVDSKMVKNDVAINTEADDNNENNYGRTNLIAMLQLQEKFKNVLDKMADLTDEKQQLEHLVMQLQSETETIEEYVALYQKQRSILQQRTRETDLKMERVCKEKERLMFIIRSILSTNVPDSSFIKKLLEHNLSNELNKELFQNSNLERNYVQSNSHIHNNENNGHHPNCHCCSGKLITL